MMLSTKTYSFKFGQKFQYLIFQGVRYNSNSPLTTIDFNFPPKLNHAEQEKIISFLNESNKDQLLSLNVSQSKIKSLENYKKKNGPFKSLDDLLDVDGLNVKLLEKLCNQIIFDSHKKNKKVVNNNEQRKLKQILTPQLQTDKIESSVGIYLAPMGVSWAKIRGKNNHLEYWGYQHFGNLPKKIYSTDIFKLATNLLSQIPEGDVYVFEGSSNGGLQGQKQSVTITSYSQQLELSSMLLALLNTSKKHNANYSETGQAQYDITNCVYFLRPKLPARLFKTLVGNECVSCTSTVLHLMGESSKEVILPCSNIIFENKLKSDYLAQSSTNKELLGQSLMLTIAFIDLCITKNLVSIKAISPGKK